MCECIDVPELLLRGRTSLALLTDRHILVQAINVLYTKQLMSAKHVCCGNCEMRFTHVCVRLVREVLDAYTVDHSYLPVILRRAKVVALRMRASNEHCFATCTTGLVPVLDPLTCVG